MIEIIPAIIAKNFQELQEKIKLIEPHVKWAQIDIMDGKFTPPITWNSPSELSQLKTSLNLEVHLMINAPEKVIDKWLEQKHVKRILIHYESTNKIQDLIKKIRGAKKEIGIVLKIETPIEVLESFINKIDLVQLMGIAEIGYYGHGFDERVLEKIKTLRQKYPKLTIEIDGGINPKTTKQCINAGANRLVAGSYIFKNKNIKEAMEKLQSTE